MVVVVVAVPVLLLLVDAAAVAAAGVAFCFCFLNATSDLTSLQMSAVLGALGAQQHSCGQRSEDLLLLVWLALATDLLYQCCCGIKVVSGLWHREWGPLFVDV